MQLLLDNLIASVVLAVLTVALVGQHTRVRQASVERTAVYAAKVHLLGLAAVVEADVDRLSNGRSAGPGRLRVSAVDRAGVAHTDTVAFSYDRPTSGPGRVLRVEVRYVLERDAAAHVVAERGPDGDVEVPVYRLRRDTLAGPYDVTVDPAAGDPWVGGRPAWTETAGYRAPPGLARFHVEPLDALGRPAPAADAVAARFHLAVVPTLFPLHEARTAPPSGLHWATTLAVRAH